MIFIKNGESFDRVNDWTEIQSRDSYHPKLVLTDQQLSDVFGYYEDLPEEIPCGKSSCRTGHNKGFLVLTEDGQETNLGHVCGTKVFGIAFENLAIDLEKKANFHRYLTALKDAKKNIFLHYQTKAKLEASDPSLEWVAHKILDLRDSKIVGRAGSQALKRMAGSGDGKVILPRKRTKEEMQMLDVMSQKASDDEDDSAENSGKPQFTDEVIGVVRNPECLLNDYNIALIFERDIRLVLEELNNCDPDAIPEKKVMSLGLKVFRLNERFQFLQERLEKARVYLTKEHLKPLNIQLHKKKSISNKDKALFNTFINSLP
ncbi:TPA: hypothetical protein ACJ2WV_004571 [Kluyvera georgiana]